VPCPEGGGRPRGGHPMSAPGLSTHQTCWGRTTEAREVLV
jgi:hypothetical protein